MRIRLVATCLAGVVLALAGMTALAGARDDGGLPGTAPSQDEIDQAIKTIGPQDPAVMAGIVSGCRDLLDQGLTNEACSELLKERGRPSDDSAGSVSENSEGPR
jgi:hypothetical protein